MTQHLRRPRGVGALVTACLTVGAALVAGCSSSAGGTNAASNTGGAAGDQTPAVSSTTNASTDTAGASTTSSTGPSTGVASDPASDPAADLAKYSGLISTYSDIPSVSGVAALKGKTVWYIPLGSAVPIIAATGNGIQQALKAAGITMQTCDGKLLPTSVAACMSQAVAQHADAVVTGYIDYALVPTAFDNLVSHGITVLVAGEAPSGGKTSSAKLGFYPTTANGELAQRLSMESIVADSNGAAKIVYLANSDSSETKDSAAYAKSYIAKNCSGCSFIEVDYNQAGVSKLASQVSAALIAHPDTTYVADELDSASSATIKGIQSAGFANKVKLASTSGNLDAVQRVKAGTQFVDIGQSPIYAGWAYADGLIRMLAGQPVVTSVQFATRVFNSDSVADLTLTPAVYATNAWYGSDDYQNTFLKAWGLS